jgi:aquaporin Z
LQQVWLFWVAPLLGAALAGISYQYLTGSEGTEPVAASAQAISRATATIGEVTANSPAPQA